MPTDDFTASPAPAVAPARIAQIEAQRTIPVERYAEDGHASRFEYLAALAEDHDADLITVLLVAELLGGDEDFDGLVSAAEEAAMRRGERN